LKFCRHPFTASRKQLPLCLELWQAALMTKHKKYKKEHDEQMAT
jgi:hypothetical protein